MISSECGRHLVEIMNAEKYFAGGNGAVFVDEVEFDDSSQAYLVQVSVPVMDGGKAIGAITFGIDFDAVD